MKAMGEVERELMSEVAANTYSGGGWCAAQWVAYRVLTKRGLLIESTCHVCGWPWIDITAIGRLALRIDAIARAVTA